ncbi:hypothetical protein [Amaricoccus solimangrovi]|uniref:Uncharacterized protein n=1 Tax=Amaricoccus solimangrovi TaxID=2589815 RepID=A0A501WQA8_9RHOB|nr:hypothetical protein [Amaricoccus solimangrovi]TPE49427.1 hypothetical protein FJM51_15000 [Amaricoccus solimangrovi]
MSRPPRSRIVAAGFLIVWLILWGAAMILAVVMLGAAALGGDVFAGLFLVVWLAGASLGLYAASRKLWGILSGSGPAGRPPVSEPWHDGMAERPTLEPLDRASIPPGRSWRDDMPPRPPGSGGEEDRK